MKRLKKMSQQLIWKWNGLNVDKIDLATHQAQSTKLVAIHLNQLKIELWNSADTYLARKIKGKPLPKMLPRVSIRHSLVTNKA